MTNLTERLRYCGKELADYYSHAAIFDEAADEIERLRMVVENYRLASDARLYDNIRSDALEEAAKVATSFLVGDPASGVPLRNPMAHEIAAAIRALKEKAGARAQIQPVAWRCVADDGVSDVTEIEGVADQWRSDGFAVAPLYAAPSQAVADGWQLVPKEITDGMLNAWYGKSTWKDAYRAMLAAAPQHQEGE